MWPAGNRVPRMMETVMSATKKASKSKPETKAEAKAPKAAENKNPALGLRFAQVRVLKVLLKEDGKHLSKSALAEKANVGSSLTATVGPYFKDDIAECDRVHGYPSLLSLKYVTAKDEGDGKMLYAITAAGTKALITLTNDVTWPFGH